MDVTLMTLSSRDYWDLNIITSQNKLEYCLRWGHNFSMKKLINIPEWKKRRKFILDSLTECDWLWYMGADALIMNHTIDVNQFLDNNYDFIIGKDANGINGDVYFLKNTESSIEFIKRIYDVNLDIGSDQAAMDVFKDQVEGFTYNIVPQKLFNAYIYSEDRQAYANYPADHEGNFQSGDFVLHFPGMGYGARFNWAKKYVQEVVR